MLVRVTHWVNVLCLLVLLMSGLQIFNAHTTLYLGEKSDPARAVLSMDAVQRNGGSYVPFARLTSRAVLFDLLGDSLYIEPREKLEQVFRDLIDDLWANPDRVEESAGVLRTIKRLLNEMFPSDRRLSILERQKIAERTVKAIYIHSHMDEENFDVARVMKCPVGVPQEDGGNIPTCSYNVLYREKDHRFADPKMLHRMTLTKPAHAAGRNTP